MASKSREKIAASNFFPYATVGLLLACASATLAFHASGGSDYFVCFPREPFALHGIPTLLSLFTHEGFPHLAVNGVLLAYAGVTLESRVGALKLLALFFLCGFAGIAGQAAVTDLATIGASGAICGLIAATLLTRPPVARVGFFELTVAVWVCLDLVGLAAQRYGHAGLVGHGAHVAGALMGLCVTYGLSASASNAGSARAP
jgi:membrane associated rhomboid family serine protease